MLSNFSFKTDSVLKTLELQQEFDSGRIIPILFDSIPTNIYAILRIKGEMNGNQVS